MIDRPPPPPRPDPPQNPFVSVGPSRGWRIAAMIGEAGMLLALVLLTLLIASQ